ncbi:phenoloxidase-activating factor 2-like [Diorhabda carinulata]|uniref:phenoloxidase-activating factor 2-like n=1 Tax=Diorhabda carinulata TaxID=1163345 RepID=UPI0025A0A823|nr:phenoloxidase-activating factor 2-like [Diorhabda carinulata]
MSLYRFWWRFVFVNCLWVTVQSGRRFKREDIVNVAIELFNNCKCVYDYQCSTVNGENMIDQRSGGESRNSTKITCKGGRFDGEIICCKQTYTNWTEITNLDYKNNTKTEMFLKCGIQRAKINVRVLTDEEDGNVPFNGEFPWIVAIYKKNIAGRWVFYCSGALIHPKVILTANHYFRSKNAADFKVTAGGYIELSRIEDNLNSTRQVVEIVNHPKFDKDSLYNDGTLLFLNEAFQITKTNSINTICMPPDDLNINNSRCLVAGWGKGSTIDGTRVLKKVDLPLVSNSKCQEQLRRTRLGRRFILHDSFMCAGGEKGKDACRGDGGSPLMCLLPGERRYFHMGIVSWGIGCGSENVPGVYASVIKMKSWILDELNKKEIKL